MEEKAEARARALELAIMAIEVDPELMPAPVVDEDKATPSERALSRYGRFKTLAGDFLVFIEQGPPKAQ